MSGTPLASRRLFHGMAAAVPLPMAGGLTIGSQSASATDGLRVRHGPLHRVTERPWYALRPLSDGTTRFARDATFSEPALADSPWSSFRSYNYPDSYIRHPEHVLRIDPISTVPDSADATFAVWY
jgi:hypothetical protein